MTSRYLPISIDVQERACLVIGGGQVALRKVEWLRGGGAATEVIAERACTELLELAAALLVSLDQRAFDDRDVERKRYAVVIAATDDRALNARVSSLAQARGIPVNVVDAPELCTFIVPALVERAPIAIGISTEGASPVLARLVRRRIESVLPIELGALARFAAQHRQAVKDALPDPTSRRTLWESVLEGEVGERVLAGDVRAAEALFGQALDDARSGRAGVAHGPYTVDVIALPAAGLDALTLRSMRALGRADAVLYERAALPAVRHFARRDATQRELPVQTIPEAVRVLQSTRSQPRICVLCEESSIEALSALLTREGIAIAS
jgi:uroporphyrin-III C-methyltransferase / precorrin-2 dehydrogenase / sirohydrochlorin ferrochelatase